MTKIISYNVNGIRSALNKNFSGWLENQDIDILCLQELKAQPGQFDDSAFEKMGFHCTWHPAARKGYSGVAVLSRTKPGNITIGCGEKIYDDEGRIIITDYSNFSHVTVYVPSGTMGEERQSFKMQFLDFFLHFITDLKKTKPNLVISGDFNICHQAIDIHDPVRNATHSGFLPEEREWVTRFLETGFIDTFRFKNPNTVKYSWWSFRAGSRSRNLGWRLDYNLVSYPMRDRIIHADILNEVEHSDHCPVVLEIQ